MSDIVRKLASIQMIEEVKPIEGADQIEAVRVLGWWVVAQKNEYKPGDLGVYLEIDSFVPTSLAPFLSKGKEPREYNGVKGERLRTVKLKGQISQGLLLSLHNLAVYKALLGTNDWREGQDVTEGLGIQKWEAPINAQLAGVARGNFPNFLRKTDQERIQNCWKDVQRHGEEVFEVTQKLDGSSCTIYWNRGDFGVCSRNLDLKSTEDNSFWKIARKYELCGRMERLERNLAIQGELCGPGIQGNPEKLSANDLYVFDIYDIDTGNYLTSEERLDLVATLDLKHVPVIGYSKPGTYGDTVDQFLKAAEGVSLLNNGANKVREGLVFKSTESQFSFKSISNAYLLGEK